MQQVVERDCKDLDKNIELYLDEEKVNLPSIESIVILNIPSWAAGVDLWNMGLEGHEEYGQKKETDFTADSIKRFIKMKSGIYLGLPGCVEQLDRLAEEFRTSGETERKEILNKAKVFEGTLPETQRAAAKVIFNLSP